MFRLALACLILCIISAMPAAAQTDPTPGIDWAPPSAGRDGFTWVQLVSDEWVKGEIKDLRDGVLKFDSDELDEFDYDWEDVKAVISSAPHTVTTWDREVHTGHIVARQDLIRVMDENGTEIAVVTPDEVSSMIQGPPRERNFWSGMLSLGSTIRSGNSDQSDGSVLIKLNRRALVSRWDNTANLNAAESGGSKTQESHRYTSKYDLFLTRNLFLTVAEYEYFRDPFQNVRQRHTPGAAFGYNNRLRGLEWDVSLGLAWQHLEYVSVTADSDPTSDGWVGRPSINLEWDLTSDIEWDLGYSVSIPFEDSDYYTSNLLTTLSVDIWWNFEFDFTLAWDRQNNPRVNEDGITPEKDDYRLTTGIGWDF